MLNDEIKLFPNISRDTCVSTAYAVVRYPSVSPSVVCHVRVLCRNWWT